MSSKLFVGGLAPTTDDAILRAAFEPHGELVEARVILDRETGRSRGFGFVTYRRPEQAQAAMERMRGAMVDGRAIRVDLAEDRRGGGERPARRYDDRPRAGPPHDRRPPSGPPGGYGERRPHAYADGPPGGRFRDGAPPPVHRRGPPRVESPSWSPPVIAPEEAGWDDARMPRKSVEPKKKERPERDTEPRRAPKVASRPKRMSGKSWRDWDVDIDEEDDALD